MCGLGWVHNEAEGSEDTQDHYFEGRQGTECQDNLTKCEVPCVLEAR